MYEGEPGQWHMQERPAALGTPCDKCPKSVRVGEQEFLPDLDGTSQLSEENAMLLMLYRRSMAPGFVLPPHLQGDSLFAERYAIVDNIVRETERHQEREMLAYELVRIVGR